MKCLFLLPLFAITAIAVADDRTRKEVAEAEKLSSDELTRWKLTADGRVLDNPKDPVLRWTNPASGRVYGNTYLWLQAGRPVAACCIFRNFEPWNTLNGELVVLAGNKLVVKRDDKLIWCPKDEWNWRSLPGASAPAATAEQRLLQMKKLVGEFTVEVLDTRNNPKGDEQTPRLLSKPLYRYEASQTKRVDGGLFAFVLGTDPELLLLLECDTAQEKPEWRFTVGRMNRDAIRLKRNKEIAWEATSFRQHKPEDNYYFLGIELPKKESAPKEPKEPTR